MYRYIDYEPGLIMLRFSSEASSSALEREGCYQVDWIGGIEPELAQPHIGDRVWLIACGHTFWMRPATGCDEEDTSSSTRQQYHPFATLST